MSQTIDLSYLANPGWYNDVYLPLHKDKNRTKILYGSRDSGKSDAIAQILILDCLRLPYFKGILSRKYQNTIKDSQWQTIKDWVETWKLDEWFHFTKSPLEIRCIPNGNIFLCRGLDQASKLKSIKDPTHFWGEEFDECSEDDYETITLSLRNSKGIAIQEYISFNSSSFKHWLPQYFFPEEKEFKKIEKADGLFTFVESIQPKTTILHTCYKHNQFITDERIDRIEQNKDRKPIKYKKNGLGLFVDDVEGALWKWSDIHEHRVSLEEEEALKGRDLVYRKVVALDPSANDKKDNDEAGIVVVGVDRKGHFYVYRDESGILDPTQQSERCLYLYDTLGLDAIVYEKNNGGKWIPTVIRGIDKYAKTEEVWASQGKRTRAEPVADLYQRGFVHHVGTLDKLEAEMTTWIPKEGRSPNRVDALVWGVSFLMGKKKTKRRAAAMA